MVIFHCLPQRLPGGPFGVQVLFVLSGWLMTGLVVTESRNLAAIDRRACYARRALRLGPALLVAVVAALILGVVIDRPDTVLARAASLHFINNFATGFGHQTGGLLDGTWSLATRSSSTSCGRSS